ncbi:MAG: class I SAM-dependent methyltransferase, partial [Phormidium sp.]
MKLSVQSAMYAKHAQLMEAQQQNYFDRPNEEVLSLIPEDVQRVLEVGCGGGATLRTLKESRLKERRICEVVGVDIEAGAISRAKKYLDAAYLMNVEEEKLTDYPPGYFDLLIMQQVLEHFVNPWATLRQWLPLVRSGGYVIIGVPNIANYRLLKRLILKDEFAYEPFGILDWTHLRFFTLTSFKELLTGAGLTIVESLGLAGKGLLSSKFGFLLHLFPALNRFTYYAYV